ncbi:MAG: ferrochelatase [Deltaproteobacteria bacterium]|nr:ferrochelatase [Deltaproteobacteria bacterium]
MIMKKAILLLAYGGPEKLSEIEPFLKRLLRREALPPGLVSRVEKKYEAIGGGSPLPAICREIRNKLALKLGDLPIFLAFRYAEPSIETVVKEMMAQNIGEIFALSLSPHSSTISSAAYYQALEKVSAGHNLQLVRLENWYREAAYNQLLAARIVETARNRGFKLEDKETRLIFSAHNIPQSYLEQGDTYVVEISANIKAVKELLPTTCISSLAYQSKGQAPGAWLEPELENHLLQLKEEGGRNFIIVPVSFSMDHLETLYDLDLELQDFCTRHQINLCRSRPANADDDFIAMLAQFIRGRLNL